MPNLVIVIGMKRQPSGKISELDEIQAVACAVQNMHLTATAHGLGGYHPKTKPFKCMGLSDDKDHP